MKIRWSLLKKPDIQTKARQLSSNFIIRRELYRLHGDPHSEIDIYLHALSYSYTELKKFVSDNNIVEYVEEVEDPSELILEFAVSNFKDPNLAANVSDEVYQLNEWNRVSAIFERFVSLIATFTYHKYRYTLNPDDRDSEERNCYYTWLVIKKFNRDNFILNNFTDDELQGTAVTWYEQSVLPKFPLMFERADIANGHSCNTVLHQYNGKAPKIPASEMVPGYGFDIAI